MLRFPDYYLVAKQKKQTLQLTIGFVVSFVSIVASIIFFQLGDYMSFGVTWLVVMIVIALVILSYYWALKYETAAKKYKTYMEDSYPRVLLSEYNQSGFYDYTARKEKPENYAKEIYVQFRYAMDDFTNLSYYAEETTLTDRRELLRLMKDVRLTAEAIDFPEVMQIQMLGENKYAARIETGNVKVMVIAHTLPFAGSMAVFKALLHEREYYKLPSFYRLTRKDWLHEHLTEHPLLSKDDEYINTEYRNTLLWHPDSEINQIIKSFMD